MKNYLLITVPLAVGLSACSTQQVNPNLIQTNANHSHTHAPAVHTTNNHAQINRNQQIANQQRQAALQKEQERLAYNRAWQNQQAAKQRAAQNLANNNRLNAQRQAQAQAAQSRARNAWLQQQAMKKQAAASAQRQQQAQAQAAAKRKQQLAAAQRQQQAQAAAQRQQQLAAVQRQQQAQAAAQRQQQLAAAQRQQQAQAQAAAYHQQRAHAQRQQQQLAMAQQQQQAYHPSQNSQGSAGISGLSHGEIRAIGDKIFKNESGGSISNLVHWNNGENFASMGIGHFTWYPSGRRARFGNTFPGLLDHLKSNGVQLPVWVQKARYSGAPWRTKGELHNAKSSRQVQELQNLLYQTRYLQATYIFDRAKRAMPRLVKATPAHLKGHVAQNLNAVANTRGGWYGLIDYVNFKGEGLARHGGYKGQNWGLLQVLENMRPSQPGQQALNNFADSAIAILQRRVNNSDPRRNEAKWMRGWTVRINTYRHPFVI